MIIRDIAIVTFWLLLPVVCFAKTPVPEPGTLSLLAIGAAAAGVTGYMKKRKK
jgi:hypothetical protein